MKLIIRLLYGLALAQAVYAPLNASLFKYRHRIINDTPFEIQVSADYSSFLCKNESHKIQPGKEHTIEAGTCLLTGIIPWFTDTPQAKAAGVFATPQYRAVRWSHGGFSGDGTWRIKYNSSRRLMTVEAELNSLGDIISDTARDTANTLGDVSQDIGMGAAAFILGGLLELANGIADAFNPESVVVPHYCYNPGGLLPPAAEPTIDDPAVQKQDTEGYNALARKYQPFVWLARGEKALPISAPEYFTSPYTSIRDTTTGAIVVPAGQVTMQRIYELFRQGGHRYFDLGNYEKNPETCVLYGSNPAFNTNKDGTLTTPVYVMIFDNPQKDSELFIQYLFFYGLNVPYDIKRAIGWGKDILDAMGLAGKITDENIIDWANFHEADLEHVTIVIDKATGKMLRIHFAAHGSDGIWLNVGDPRLQMEGTHAVVYSARGSHASYPFAAIWVRIYGFANDITDKGTKWIGNLVRVFKDNDPRFNPAVHGWIMHGGTYGKHGVGAAYAQMGNGEVAGKDINTLPFCGQGDSQCVRSKAVSAKP